MEQERRVRCNHCMSTFYEEYIGVDVSGPYSGETCPVCMKGDALMDIADEDIMWTKLKTKRPPKNGDYLCMISSCGGSYMGVMCYRSEGTLIEDAVIPYNLRSDLWTCVGGTTQHMNDYITHWMEVPEAPSNEREEIK